MSNRVTVNDYEAFGELVKKWVRGEVPHPTEISELKDQAADHGVGITIPDNYKHLEVIHRDLTTFRLVLPDPSLVKATEAAIGAGGEYPLPPFYDALYGIRPRRMDQKEMMSLHARRIADYTLGQCG